MRKLFYIALICAFSPVIISCVKKQDTRLTEEAGKLYKESVRLTLVYTDSVMKATDSTTVHLLTSNFENQLTKLNFKYPADTDIDMDEGQNDTIERLNQRFVTVRDSMLYYFAHRKAIPDTLANDTTDISASKID